MSITAFPLAWPPGWKRTDAAYKTLGRFGKARQSSVGGWMTRADLTISEATNRLLSELERMGADRDDVILSTNLQLRLDGLPKSGQKAPLDSGAAVYWRDPHDKQPRCMAIDQYTAVEQNIAALAATIEAMRAIERHGGAVVMQRAFTGFAALPAPITAGMKRPWREVLEFFDSPRELAKDDVRARYRRLASEHHPDRQGGSAEKMAELNQARDEALKECS